MTNKLKPYKKEFGVSYAVSAYIVIELLMAKPELTQAVFVRSNFTDKYSIKDLCYENNIPVIYSDKAFSQVNDKDNCYVIAVFRKYETTLSSNKPHIVLVNPSDMGNLGTIIRTAVGFHIKDIAIISPNADIFNPKTIRASMGAIFRVNFQFWNDFHEYAREYPKHQLFPFMKDGVVTPDECTPCLFSLIFGNEATGLDKSYQNLGQSVRIPISGNIDSLNLSIAAGIGMYMFAIKMNG